MATLSPQALAALWMARSTAFMATQAAAIAAANAKNNLNNNNNHDGSHCSNSGTSTVLRPIASPPDTTRSLKQSTSPSHVAASEASATIKHDSIYHDSPLPSPIPAGSMMGGKGDSITLTHLSSSDSSLSSKSSGPLMSPIPSTITLSSISSGRSMSPVRVSVPSSDISSKSPCVSPLLALLKVEPLSALIASNMPLNSTPPPIPLASSLLSSMSSMSSSTSVNGRPRRSAVLSRKSNKLDTVGSDDDKGNDSNDDVDDHDNDRTMHNRDDDDEYVKSDDDNSSTGGGKKRRSPSHSTPPSSKRARQTSPSTNGTPAAANTPSSTSGKRGGNTAATRTNARFTCTFDGCTSKFQTPFAYRRHIRKHTGMLLCHLIMMLSLIVLYTCVICVV
jgi:hypothetical protein